MSKTSENPKIGLDNVVIAELISDDGINAPVYGEVIPLRGAVQASVNPNSSVEVDYADNGAFFVTGNRANTGMTLELTNVDSKALAKMLGQKRVNGVTVETPMDQAPYFAMGFRVWIGGTDDEGNNIYQYFWYAKGKFSVPENGGTTKQENVDFQHTSMTAQFVSTQYKDETKGSGVFCCHCRSDDDDAPKSLITSWFNAPIVSPSADVSTLTVAIAQGSSRSKLTITGTKTSGETTTFALDSIKLGENVIVTKESVEVAGVITVSNNVITFTTDEPFSTSDDVIVTVTNGLKDVYGVSAGVTTETVTIA